MAIEFINPEFDPYIKAAIIALIIGIFIFLLNYFGKEKKDRKEHIPEKIPKTPDSEIKGTPTCRITITNPQTGATLPQGTQTTLDATIEGEPPAESSLYWFLDYEIIRTANNEPAKGNNIQHTFDQPVGPHTLTAMIVDISGNPLCRSMSYFTISSDLICEFLDPIEIQSNTKNKVGA